MLASTSAPRDSRGQYIVSFLSLSSLQSLIGMTRGASCSERWSTAEGVLRTEAVGRWMRLSTAHTASCLPTTSLFKKGLGAGWGLWHQFLSADHSQGWGIEKRRKFQVSYGAPGSIIAHPPTPRNLLPFPRVKSFIAFLLFLLCNKFNLINPAKEKMEYELEWEAGRKSIRYGEGKCQGWEGGLYLQELT